MQLAFLIPTFGLPVFGLIVNCVLRVRLRLPQSAVPDLILSFVIIDAVIAMESSHFENFVQVSAIKAAVPHVYGGAALLFFCFWLLAVIDLETRLFNWYKSNGRFLSFYAMRILFASLVLATVVVFASLAPFAI